MVDPEIQDTLWQLVLSGDSHGVANLIHIAAHLINTNVQRTGTISTNNNTKTITITPLCYAACFLKSVGMVGALLMHPNTNPNTHLLFDCMFGCDDPGEGTCE